MKIAPVYSSTFFLVCCAVISACVHTPPVADNIAPSWVHELPQGKSAAVASASYEIFGEAKARENAEMKALTALALQKGAVVEVEGRVKNDQRVNSVNGSERVTDRSTVSTTAVIKGSDISIKGKVQSYWKDTAARRIWVLMVEEKIAL